MIELYKDGDRMAILTDAKDERGFIDEISNLFEDMISRGEFMGLGGYELAGYSGGIENLFCNDWAFQFSMWLPQIVDICCKYRGYKSSVEERRIIVAGNSILGGVIPIATNRPNKEKAKAKDGKEDSGQTTTD